MLSCQVYCTIQHANRLFFCYANDAQYDDRSLQTMNYAFFSSTHVKHAQFASETLPHRNPTENCNRRRRPFEAAQKNGPKRHRNPIRTHAVLMICTLTTFNCQGYVDVVLSSQTHNITTSLKPIKGAFSRRSFGIR